MITRKIISLLLASVWIIYASATTDDEGIYAWIDGSSTCYKLETVPSISYTTKNGQDFVQLTLEGNDEPCLILPLTDGNQLTVTYGEYISTTLTLNSYGFTTFSCSQPTHIVSGADAYTVNLSGTTLTCKSIPENNIPAYAGVLLFGESKADVTLNIIESADQISINDLKATTTENGLADIEEAYVLKNNNFVNYTGTAFTPGKAYLPKSLVTAGSDEARLTLIPPSGISTGIDDPDYEKPDQIHQSGKYIWGGKLVVIDKNNKYGANGLKLEDGK